MEIFRGNKNLIPVLKSLVFILVVNEAEGFWRWNEQPLPQPRPITYAFYNRHYYPAAANYDNDNSDSIDEDIKKIFQVPTVPRDTNNMQADGKVAFPGYNINSRNTETLIAPSCEGSTFCEEVPDYPTDLVNNIIMNDRSLRNYANVDVADIISQRIDDSDSEPLCISTEKVVYPKSGVNMDNKWLFIVNHQNLTQGVRIETCEDQGNGCKLIDGFAEGYVTSCEQKYIYRELTAIDPNGSVGREYFRFPASCCCHVRFIGMMAPRSAQPQKVT